MAGINQFQRPASPLEGLTHIASLVGAVKDWSNKSKQSDLLDQDIQAKTLANTQSGMKSEQDKKTLAALQTADSPETTNITIRNEIWR